MIRRRLSKNVTFFKKMSLFSLFPFIGFATNQALAKTIPYNPDFPNALFPYAQAPDGCSGWSDPGQVRDTWGPVNFTEACNAHDRCYYTWGELSENCNTQFHLDLKWACQNDLRIWVPEVVLAGVVIVEAHWMEPVAATLELCLGLANTYHFAVVEAVNFGVFDEAQNLQSRYETWIQSLP
jgi:hypothetical protein